MASIIRIKRSSVSGNPSTLGAGELAYSGLTDNGSNGGDRLYIGLGTETAGNAANHIVIGGKFFTDMLDHAKGTVTANSALIVDADSKLDVLNVDNLTLNGNTLSSTNTNGNLLIVPNGTGKTVITNPYIDDDATSLAEYIYDTVGGAITSGTGITITNSDGDNTSTVSITNTGVTANTYGSATSIPVIAINAQGQITSASTASVASSLSIAGDSGTDSVALLSDTLTFTGGTGITTTVTNNVVTVDIDSTVATLTGSQTLTNKTISGSNNTLSNIDNSSLTNSSVTIGSTSVSLGATATSLAGLTELTVDNININNNTIAATNTNGNVVLAPDGTGTVDASGKRITGVATPTEDTDAANKLYVDTVVAEGLHVQNGCDAATTATLATLSGGTVTYSNGTGGVGATLTTTGSYTSGNPIDDVAISLNPTKNPQGGGRVLVKNEANAAHNGIYYLINATTLERDPLFDSDAEVEGGDFVFVVEGTINGGTGWVQTNTVNTIGTDEILWAQFSGAGTYTAGSGISIVGTEISAKLATDGGIEFSGSNAIQLKSGLAGDGLSYATGVLTVGGTSNRITVNADSIDIAATYVGQTSITTLGTISSGTWNGGVITGQYGGTGVDNTGKTITLGGNLTTSGAYAVTLTATGATNVTLPTTGTLATLAGSESLSNKTILSSSFSGTTVAASGLVTLTNATDASALGTAAVVLSGGLSVAKAIYVGTNIVGSGDSISTLDGFNIDGGTY